MKFDYPDFSKLPVTEVQAYFQVNSDTAEARAIASVHLALEEKAGALPSGLAVLDILGQLGVDETTRVAALLSDSRLRSIDLADIERQYGDGVSTLVASVRWLHSFRDASSVDESLPEQAERLRRLLMQAVSDVRAILIKLAYRVERLRHLSNESDTIQRSIARETLDIYAPLANRLGIGQLKWELEDFGFRYLEPDTYKSIAKQLEERRQDREHYMQDLVGDMQALLVEQKLDAQVMGRPKHIFSIVKKMRQKSLGFEQVYDVRAIRIIVENLTDCYAVLGLVHSHWPHIASEFDDYIANAKDNGYQSLHTVIVGPQHKAVEVQIRTRQMHELAESGVAAHWRYKEQGQADEQLQNSIDALRALLDAEEVDETLLSDFRQGNSSRVYVFTPQGDVVDLVKGATPLDFAYAIHTEVGHRCRGAKVNGRIVALNYTLQDADQIEIMTGKESRPTREWLNPHLGYLFSRHARAKVRNWFNKLDYEQHIQDGGYLFERELNRYSGRGVSDGEYAGYFGFDEFDDFLAAIGRGTISSAQILAAIQKLSQHSTAEPVVLGRRKEHATANAIRVSGVGNLMTQMAACCQPIPGDPVIGFITRGRGVSIHRQDCNNIKALSDEDSKRLISVDWDNVDMNPGEVALSLEAFDREGLLRDITSVLSREKIHLNELNTRSNRIDQTAVMDLVVEIRDVGQLSTLIEKLNQVPNVIEVRRR